MRQFLAGLVNELLPDQLGDELALALIGEEIVVEQRRPLRQQAADHVQQRVATVTVLGADRYDFSEGRPAGDLLHQR